MAKQSGLHQIRGKVGEHSYYRQTGVNSGLIRSINQGMSVRVKTGEEFANTRKNMQEFGFAAEIAGRLGTFVQPKFRPMVLPFSQSKMAKDVLALIKGTSTAAWGWRGIGQADFEQILNSLNHTAKYPFDNFISDFSAASETISALREDWAYSFFFQTGVNDLLASIGAQGVYVKAIAINVINEDPAAATLKLGHISSRIMTSVTTSHESIDPATEENGDLSGIFTPNIQAGQVYHRVVCVLVMPYRKIASENSILQEYCSFKSFIVPEPEE